MGKIYTIVANVNMIIDLEADSRFQVTEKAANTNIDKWKMQWDTFEIKSIELKKEG